MAKILRGENIMAFVGGKSIGFATAHTLSITMSPIEVSHKDVNGGSWYEAEGGIINWEMSSSNFYANEANGMTYSELVDLMIKRQPVQLVMALKSNVTEDGTAFEVPTGGWTAAAGDGFQGKALITSVSANHNNGEASTFEVSFTGVGALTKVPAVAAASVTKVNAKPNQ